MKWVSRLDQLIEKESWEDLSGLSPVLVTNSLSFEDCLRLAGRLTGEFTYEVARDYSLRLYYQLKRQFRTDWEASWENEYHLGQTCSIVYRYHEEYYAYRRAARLVSPIPADLALSLACCYSTPDPLMSVAEATHLCERAVQEYRSASVLRTLKSLYQDMPGCEAKVHELERIISQMDDEPFELPPYSPYIQSYDLSIAARKKIIIVRASGQQIKHWIQHHSWLELFELNPKLLVESISFQDSLRLAYRFIQMDAEFQEYAVRLLYALRYYCFGPWSKDWRNETLLGHACEVTGKTDEQFGAFDQACFFASKISASLNIAVARASLASDPPPLSNQEVIDLLQNALKEDMYVDALELLKQVYAQTGQQDKEGEVTRSIANLKGQGTHSPSILPACVKEPFDAL